MLSKVNDGTGSHFLTVGTDILLPGVIFNFNIAFDTTTATYTLTVRDKSNSETGSISGSLEGASPGGIGAFKLQSADTDLSGSPAGGGSQILVVDNTQVELVPEPATLISFLSGASLLGAMMLIRGRRS